MPRLPPAMCAKAICGIPATSCFAPMCCSPNWRVSSRRWPNAIEAAVDNASDDLGFLRLDPDAFARAPQKSIDYAVMEKTDRAAVVAGDFRWSDIGSWDALFDITQRDDARQCGARSGRDHGHQDCVVHSDERLTAVVGVKDLVVVSTSDAVMVVPRARAQEVRELVDQAQGRQARRRRPTISACTGPGAIMNRSTWASAFRSSASSSSRRHSVIAETPPPRRALGRGARHRRGHYRRAGPRGARKRVGLHSRSAACTGWPTREKSRSN